MTALRMFVLALVGVLAAACVAGTAPDVGPKAVAPFDDGTAKKCQKQTAEYYGAGVSKSVELAEGVKMELLLIPSGEFHMGSSSRERQRYKDEGPAHHIRISRPFYMGKYEVTQAQYKAVFGDTVFAQKDYAFKGDNLPVETVSWYEADKFLKELSKKTGLKFRLPREAEWEFACRAGTTTPFHCGETISSDNANYDASKVYGHGVKGLNMKRTVDVGSYPANAFGLHDMHGNVTEWCGDWYYKYYYKETQIVDPPGPPNGKDRVIRGGSWKSHPAKCRSADRDLYRPSKSSAAIGFRVVLPVDTSKVKTDGE